MKKFINMLKEEVSKESIYTVKTLGNFYGGKYYETGVDSIFVLAASPEEALTLAKKNIDVITAMFKEKKYTNGKKSYCG